MKCRACQSIESEKNQGRLQDKIAWHEYDFTDDRQHQVRVEAILAPEPHRRYFVCIDGRRACPPEYCGGPWRFMALRQHYCRYYIMERLLEIIEDGGSQEHHQEELEALHFWFTW